MEENDDPNKPPAEPPTPDVAHLLKILDLQAAQRPRRQPTSFQAPAFRYGALIAIVVFAFASLGFLEWFLSQLPKPPHPAAPSPTPAHAQATP
jgi:hypothetical protein